MKYSHKLSDAVHILAYVAIAPTDDLSSTMIAASIESNPSLVRRLMAKLVKAGLLQSQPGTVAPALGKAPAAISLLAVYRAVEDKQSLLHVDEQTNPQCIIGGNIQATLNGFYDDVQQAAEAKMAQVSLADITADILTREAAKTK
ncbi:Rrf2 family transcriptional regulator [Lacticaseibacillus baoqingensis]|uniref:Rrf2 family transcriptional regulator n=1 Tax=Lacticaseibacillus baoqingensis TaxID=2486013 RepID=A0ABW4EAT3_9LACO|nr:Rrf2 family transcriptional regulator [Lacticaseibacillus baoqingensis]